MADYIGTHNNNGSPNFGNGLIPGGMPSSATASEADGPGIMPELCKTSTESNPPAGGNDGEVADSKIVG